MGYAVAEAAARAGHDVVLITGPVHLPEPPGLQVVRVESALEMHAAVDEAFGECDCLVMAAAVADYRPAERIQGKIKKTPGPLELRLVRNPDILAEMGAKKGRRLLVGFALESADGEKNALEKLRAKHLDMIVLNTPAAFAADEAEVTILDDEGGRTVLRKTSKQEIARAIVERIHTMKART